MNTNIFNSDTPNNTKLLNDLEVYHNNKGEIDFLYNEIFAKETYFRNGISLKDGSTVLDIGAMSKKGQLLLLSNCPFLISQYEVISPQEF